ncbi:HSP90 family molecular chaperone [Aequitasia blattaphilus]|uniref:Flagellar protein FliT n=1 Tax=Aequitasia blattaphilus TaxID=2949332 RepID=A0ABT1E9N4_9FIRM|nr:hypothetical protein [Aequitasia blattaphilus]MCP1102535.1 hypothetical protein [Aequitasia blattaphilus]MCR8615175.1 hypothetical protein [Aequitasia blattaphilus]
MIENLYQRKSRHLKEVWQLTKDLGDAIGNDDKVVMQMILSQRGKELEKIAQVDEQIQQILDQFNDAQLKEAKKLIDRHTKKMMRTWSETVELDRRLNSRLAGKDSFYSDSTQTGPPL